MPKDDVVHGVGVPSPTSIVLLDEEQQRTSRESCDNNQSSQRNDDQQHHSTGDDLFAPEIALPVPQHVLPPAPPPPTTNYLCTNFTTTGRRQMFANAAIPQTSTSPKLNEDSIRTKFHTINRQLSNPVAIFMRDHALGNTESSNSMFPPTDYDDVEPTAMPFISSSDCSKEERPDPTKGFRGNTSNLKLSIRYMIIGAVIGIAIGIIVANVGVSDITVEWISLPSKLFLRSVNALVVPYVFCSVAVAVGDILFAGKGSIVVLQTLKIFVTGWVVSTILGISLALAFRPLFRLKNTFASPDANAVGLTCSNGLMVEVLTNGSIFCSSDAKKLLPANAFVLNDVHKVFKTNSDAVKPHLTFSKQLTLTHESVVSDNMFASLSDGNLLAIIAFGMALGSIAGRSNVSNTCRVNYLYLVLLQLRNIFFRAMEWLIWTTPVAVVSSIAGAFASNLDAMNQLLNVYMFPLACISATALQVLFVYPFLIFILARCNPYAHMHRMIRPYLFAFGSSSSLATAPVTLDCIQKARVCSQSIAAFVVSVGVVTNMSGSGWYYPIGMIFLAESSGIGDTITVLRLVAIFFLTIVACTIPPPIPNGGMVVMSTMYKTVFGVSILPSSWAIYVTLNFFADRLLTICNVNDDIMALIVITENIDETGSRQSSE